ncbi:TorD/DmsD family molecular chaperone [Phycobacter sp. K97]|jgi:TorA maturation chaperone TorD|uniref:TorD/DmsD family molecular chaperone n=1 Tax=Phycobacter sedimenti TaxID=3133977 RepID=UPI00311E535C
MNKEHIMTATADTSAPLVSEEDRLRADLYNFLGLILAAPPDGFLLGQTAGLEGDDTDLGVAINALAKIAKLSKPAAVEREFNKLFIGLGRGELLPYASYYLTGFLNEKPLAQLRRDMAARGMTRAANVYEPEDNIASLMEMMGALIAGRFGAPASLADQKTFFNTHIGPWAGHFFSDLEKAKNSVLYASVGAVGRVFMEIEAEAFRMSAEKSA